MEPRVGKELEGEEESFGDGLVGDEFSGGGLSGEVVLSGGLLAVLGELSVSSLGVSEVSGVSVVVLSAFLVSSVVLVGSVSSLLVIEVPPELDTSAVVDALPLLISLAVIVAMIIDVLLGSNELCEPCSVDVGVSSAAGAPLFPFRLPTTPPIMAPTTTSSTTTPKMTIAFTLIPHIRRPSM